MSLEKKIVQATGINFNQERTRKATLLRIVYNLIRKDKGWEFDAYYVKLSNKFKNKEEFKDLYNGVSAKIQT